MIPAVVTAFLNGIGARPEVLLTALVVGILSAILPVAAARGLWALAGLGALALAVLLLPLGAVNALPVVAGIWLCCAVFALRGRLLER